MWENAADGKKVMYRENQTNDDMEMSYAMKMSKPEKCWNGTKERQ